MEIKGSRVALLIILLIAAVGVLIYSFYPYYGQKEKAYTPRKIVKRVKIEPPSPEVKVALKEGPKEEKTQNKGKIKEKEVAKKEEKRPEVPKPEIFPPLKMKEKKIAKEPPREEKAIKEAIKAVKKEAVKEVQKEKKESIKKVSSLSKPWAINVSSTGSEEEARELAEKLRKKGYNSYVTRFKDKEGIVWHRVRVGFFSSREKAKAVAQKIGQELTITDYWIVKPSKEEVKRFAER